MQILSIFGTRPEAIKMAPLAKALRSEPGIDSLICVTGQHREMLDKVIALFGLAVDHDLDVLRPKQSINQLSSLVISGIDEILARSRPDCVLIQGDTTTAASAAMAAFHRRVPIAHVEAGLRTGNPVLPFPEEMNRRMIDAMSTWLFAPTAMARHNLEREQVPGRIWVTGNTGIDAVAAMARQLASDPGQALSLAGRYSWLDAQRKLVVITGHRRENVCGGFRRIFQAIVQLSHRQDVQIVYAMHLNPGVRDMVLDSLGGRPNIHLVEPLNYLAFVWFMQRAHLIMTDSGGVQEEAAFLRKPVLVMRTATERPESVATGNAVMVGTDPRRIVDEAERVLDAPPAACGDEELARTSPYGDGHASERIVAALCGRQVHEFDARRAS